VEAIKICESPSRISFDVKVLSSEEGGQRFVWTESNRHRLNEDRSLPSVFYRRFQSEDHHDLLSITRFV
jgi:hypothetical protein